MLILGLDPSLSCTGWGIVARAGNRLSHVANGQIKTDPAASLAERLVTIDAALAAMIAEHRPACAAVEDSFLAAVKRTKTRSTLTALATMLVFGAAILGFGGIAGAAEPLALKLRAMVAAEGGHPVAQVFGGAAAPARAVPVRMRPSSVRTRTGCSSYGPECGNPATAAGSPVEAFSPASASGSRRTFGAYSTANCNPRAPTAARPSMPSPASRGAAWSRS